MFLKMNKSMSVEWLNESFKTTNIWVTAVNFLQLFRLLII